MAGIDATPFVITRMPEHLRANGVYSNRLYHGDFLEFEAPEQYDLVCSFGFIEHFYNFEEIIEKHIRMVKPTGRLLLSCPNFRGLQYLFHLLLDRENLRRHVLAAMNLACWRKILEKNGMRVEYEGYYQTVDFWWENDHLGFVTKKLANHIQRIAGCINRRVNWPNPFSSPYMISISTKA